MWEKDTKEYADLDVTCVDLNDTGELKGRMLRRFRRDNVLPNDSTTEKDYVLRVCPKEIAKASPSSSSPAGTGARGGSGKTRQRAKSSKTVQATHA